MRWNRVALHWCYAHWCYRRMVQVVSTACFACPAVMPKRARHGFLARIELPVPTVPRKGGPSSGQGKVQGEDADNKKISGVKPSQAAAPASNASSSHTHGTPAVDMSSLPSSSRALPEVRTTFDRDVHAVLGQATWSSFELHGARRRASSRSCRVHSR